ncbi:hypothetical protein PFISCL1PPCAC_7591, partial [Pristionchus fissidentatus]
TVLLYYSKPVRCYNGIIQFPTIGTSKATEILCRKNRGCDMDRYYKSEKCDLKEKCVQPAKTDKFNCPDGMKLEAMFEDKGKWENIGAVECNLQNFEVIETDGKKSVKIPLLFRCVKNAVCEADVAFDGTACRKGDKCQAPTKSTTIPTQIDCPASDSLEALPKGKQTWMEIDKIECYNAIILPFEGVKERKYEDFQKFRCHEK